MQQIMTPSAPGRSRFQALCEVLLRTRASEHQLAQRPAVPCKTVPKKPTRVQALIAVFLSLSVSSIAAAFTAPAAGDFGFDVYDIVVNQILNGPIGFIGGVALIVFGATQIMKNWFSTILCIIAGTVLIRAEALVVTLGWVVG